MMKLIVFRDKDYYSLSKTILSPIVHDSNSIGSHRNKNERNKKWDRCDWGFVSLAIEEGLEVSFRRATDEEIATYTKRLENIRGSLMEDPSCNAKGSFPVYKVANQDGFGILLKKILEVDKVQGGRIAPPV